MKRLFLLFILFFFIRPAFAQNEQEAEKYYALGIEEFEQKHYEDALAQFRKCDGVRTKEEGFIGVTSNTDHWIGYILSLMGKVEEAQKECLYYWQIKPEDFRRFTSELEIEKQALKSKKAGDYSTALMLSRRYLAQYILKLGSDHYFIGDAYAEMAYLAQNIDDEKDKVVKYYDKSIECFAKMGDGGKAACQFLTMNKCCYLLASQQPEEAASILPDKKDLIPQHKAYWYFIRCFQEQSVGNAEQINNLAAEYENDADCSDDTVCRQNIKQMDISAYESRGMFNECIDRSFELLAFLEKQYGTSSLEYLEQSIKTGGYLRNAGRVTEETLLYVKPLMAEDGIIGSSLDKVVEEPDIHHPMLGIMVRMVCNLFSATKILGEDSDYSYFFSSIIELFNRMEWTKRQNTPDFSALLELYAVSIKYLADDELKKGNIKEGIKYYEDALAIPSIRESSWAYAIIQNCAVLYYLDRNYRKAIEYFEETYRRDDSGDGTEESNLMVAYAHTDPTSLRIAELDSIFFAKHQRAVITTLLATTDDDREYLWNNKYINPNRGFAVFANMCGGRNAAVNRLAYNALLLGRGFLLSSQTDLQKTLASSSDTTLRNLSDSIRKLESASNSFKEFTREWSEIMSEQKRLEALLAQKLSQNVRLINNYTTTTEDIQRQMSMRSIAVEFVYMIDSLTTKNHSYYAFLLRKDWQSPRLIKLDIPNDFFASKDIYTNENKTSLLWDKICETGRISKGDTIYFAADKDIHAVNIENMRHKNGKLISDKYHIVRLSSTRELCRREVKKVRSSNAFLYGGLDYTADGGISKSVSDGNRGADIGLSPLPYSKEEVKSIEQVLMEADRQANVICYADQAGTEQSFRDFSGQAPDILHLATHGAYLDGEAYTMERSVLYLSGSEPAYYGESVSNTECDGILSAAEICDMDLSGTDMVAMSACNSALGNIDADGVFGLQRGFKIAGVKSILMSLWEVDDEATCKLMTEFYSNWIGRKMTKHDALEAAKRTVRETKGWEDPKYWAAFILLDGLD